jgi:hypothetical protein
MDRGIGVLPTVKMCPQTSADGQFMEPQSVRWRRGGRILVGWRLGMDEERRHMISIALGVDEVPW